MAILRTICWALLFILKLRFPPGQSLVDIFKNYILKQMLTVSFIRSNYPIFNDHKLKKTLSFQFERLKCREAQVRKDNKEKTVSMFPNCDYIGQAALVA